MRKHVIRFFDRKFRRRIFARSLRVEQLEARMLMNVDWRNPVDNLDVDSDLVISPLDVLVVINDLNARGARGLPLTRNPTEPYLDTTGNQSVDPLDVLTIINYLNLEGSGTRTLTEQGQYSDQQEINITLGQATGARLYRMEVNANFGAASGTGLVPDLFSVYLVDPANLSHTLLDRGVNGTSLFSLSPRGSEMALGLARWDGHILEIDLSSIKNQDTGLLRVQLLNADPSSQSTVSVLPLANAIDSERIAGTLFSTSGTIQVPGPAMNLASLTSTSTVKAEVENVRFDSALATFVAEVGIINLGTAIGRDVALVLPGLPPGVTLSNASGISTSGVPYLNLRAAIKAGGLGPNSQSDRVELQINNPGRQLFTLQPQILVGVTNRAPVLATIPTQTVTPGGQLAIQLAATDADNDQVTYTALESGRNGLLPTGRLQSGTGLLVFTPTLNDLGAYQIEVMANDGALSASRSFTLNVVADPITSTRISGRVLDVDQTPIVGMRVEIGGVQGLTQSDGSFTLNLGSGQVVSDTLKVRGDLFAGPMVYPFIAEKLAFMLKHDVYASVNNVIDRPIFLPKLDVANGKTINPAQDTIVTTAAIPGASVMVAAGTLMNQQGTPFTGVLSITEVPVGLTPAVLPVNLRPDLVVTIQPGDMVFATPAPMSFPNRGGWSPGTRMDLWSINPVTGQFDDVGDMQVSADGATIDTISGGVRNSSWHFPDPGPPKKDPPSTNPANPDPGCNCCKVSAKANSIVELHSGAEIETHSLASYMSQGLSHSWTLTYDSERADPRPIVHFGFLDTQPFANLKLVASMTLTRGDFTFEVPGYQGGQYGLNSGDHIWSISPDDPDAEAALQADMRNAPSGRYQANVTQGLMQFDGQRFTGTSVTSDLDVLHINTINSQFGAGWGLDGLQEIVENPDGSLLLIDGNGDERFFQAPSAPGQPYISPPGVFSTLVRQSDLTFRMTTTDKMVYAFNAQNKLASITDRNRNVMTFAYDGLGRLIKITDPVGLETSFTIGANGKVSQITDPANRVTKFEYDAASNLTRVIDPDTTARTWQYDAEHHMTGEIDKRGSEEQTVYDFAGRVQQAVLKDGTVRQYQPLQLRNLLPLEASINPLSPPVAHSAGKAIASFADANGNVTVNILDRAGQMVSSSDSSGRLPSVLRNDQNEVTNSTDGRGHVTVYEYDERGNVVSMRDEGSGGNQVIGAISAAGSRKDYTFTGSVGQRIYYDALPSASDDLRVQLFSPTGKSIFFSRDDLNQGPFTLDEAGVYRLELFGNNGALGDYAFSLYSPTTSFETLSVGQEVSGEILVPGEMDVFTFTGTVGQRLYYDSLPSSIDSLLVNLISPTGQQIFLSDEDSNSGPYILDEAGPYRLNLFGNGDAIGDYHFRVVEPRVTIASITLGTDIIGTIDLPGDIDVFTFTGTVGQQLFYDALPSVDESLLVNLVSPTGRQIFLDHDDSDNGPYTLDEAGPYRLNLFGSGDAIGDYHFKLFDMASQPLVIGTPIIGSLAPGLAATAFRFTGAQGQRLTFDSQQAGNAKWFLYGPSSQVVEGNVGIVSDFTVTLPSSAPYTLLLAGSDELNSVNYSFQVNDVSDVPVAPSGFDLLHSGSIAAGQIQTFNFDAPAGLSVFFNERSISKSTSLRAELQDPQNQQVFVSDDMTDLGPTILQRSGTYTLTIMGDTDSSTGDFAFMLLDLINGATPITIGAEISDQLVGPGDRKNYTFTGSVGQRIFYDALQNDFDAIRKQLFSPSGVLLYNDNTDDNDGPLTLTEAGTYQLLVSGDNNAVGTFSFRILAPTFVSQQLSIGTVISDQLAAPGDRKEYTFTGSVGQRIFYDSLQNDLVSSRKAQLFTPSGATLFDFQQDFDEGSYTLSEAGTYRLLMTGVKDTVGTFRFRIIEPTFNSQPLTIGATVSDQLVVPGDRREYTFTGSVGQRIFYDSLQNDFGDGRKVQLITPSGETLFNNNQDFNEGPYTLSEAGTYRLLMTGVNDTVGTFSFRVYATGLAPIVLLDSTIIGSLPAGLSSEFFQWNGVAGERFFFDAIRAANLDWSLYGPGNAVVAGSSSFGDFEVTLPVAGPYFLELSSNDTNASVPYQFRIVTPETTTIPLILDALTTGAISEVGERDIFTFNGGLSQKLFYDSQHNDFAAINFTIVSPGGATIIKKNTDDENFAPFALTETGTYQLIVDATGDVTGTYRFRLMNASSATTITRGSTVLGTLAPGLASEVYRLEGVAGQRVRLDFTATTGYGWELDGPGDVCVACGMNPGTNIPVNLPSTGTYFVMIRGTNAAALHNYGFTVTDISDAPVAISGLPIAQSGNLIPLQEVTFNFSANAGTNLLFDSLDDDSDAAVAELRDPANNFVFSQSASNDFGPFTLSRSGSYTLKIRNSSPSVAADYNFRMVNLANAQALLVNSTVSGSLTVPFQTDAFSFNATAGQRLYLDTRQTNLGPFRQRLIGPDGQTIFDEITNIGVDPITITLSGRYMLLIGGSETTAGNYSFRLFDVLAAPKLAFNTLITDATTQGVEADVFHFDGLANQTISILTTSPVINSRARLFDAGNQLLASITVGIGQDVVLPNTGDYVLVIDANATFTQSYTLQIVPQAITTIPITPRTLPSTAPGLRTFTYDATFSQETSMTDELGRKTLFEIDPTNGNTLSVTRVIGAVGGGDDLVTSFTYTAHRLINTITDPLGRITDFDYDALDRLVQMTSAFGTSDQGVTHYEYDVAGNVAAMIDENGHRTTYLFDVMNRPTKVTSPDPDGAGPLTSPVTQFVYDANGNPTQVTDPRNNLWQYQFDSLDRVVKTIDPNNVETRNSFDPAGNLTSVTDSLNQTTRYEYDSRNRVSRSIDPAGGVTQFKYDADDQLTSLTDSVGNTTRSQYDARGRVLRHTDPLGQNSVYEWNEVNNLMAMVDRNGRRTEFAYDDVDRRTSEHWVAGGNTISYAYNKASNLLTATDTFSGLAMAYDARNRVRTVNNAGTSGVPNVVLTYTYDATSNRLSTADTIGGASGGLNSYSYDALDRVTRVAQSGSNVSNKRVDMTYNSLGQFSSIQRFKDLGGTQLVVGTNYTYDSLNRLTGLHHHNAASTDVSFFDFVYDTDSRITRITDIDGATDYSYNTRDELTGANHADVNNPDETYSYDANGNRITSSRHGSGYVTGANNRLLSDGTFNYSYDNEGNLTRRTEIATGKVRDFTWDYRNRLTAVIDKTAANVVTQRVAFTYDTFGRRISKAVDTTPLDAVDAVITHFVYDGQDVLLDFVDTDGSGPVAATLAQRYLYGPAVDQILAQDNGAGNVLWHLTDHMGTVRDLANSNGAVVNHLTYDSYGNVISQSNAAQGTRYGFTGRELDAETRLYYYRSRYYDPNIGRFINEDRIGFRGGDANLYSYVGNSPVAFSDPSGNKAGDFKGSGKIEKFKHGSGDAWDSEKGTLELANGETVEAFLNKEKNPGLAHNTDCHGYTFVDGKYWINSDQVEKILTGDRYKELYFGYGAKIGDVVVYRKWTLEKGWEVIHSVKVSGVSELGFPREVEGKGGVDDKIEKKPPIWLLNPFGGGWGDPRDLVTVRYYRK